MSGWVWGPEAGLRYGGLPTDLMGDAAQILFSFWGHSFLLHKMGKLDWLLKSSQ